MSRKEPPPGALRSPDLVDSVAKDGRLLDPGPAMDFMMGCVDGVNGER